MRHLLYPFAEEFPPWELISLDRHSSELQICKVHISQRVTGSNSKQGYSLVLGSRYSTCWSASSYALSLWRCVLTLREWYLMLGWNQFQIATSAKLYKAIPLLCLSSKQLLGWMVSNSAPGCISFYLKWVPCPDCIWSHVLIKHSDNSTDWELRTKEKLIFRIVSIPVKKNAVLSR